MCRRRSFLLLWAPAFIAWSVLTGSPLYAQDGEIKVRGASYGPLVFQGTTSPNDPLDKKRNVHCKTYVVDLLRGKGYVIELNSTEFFAYLRIEDSDGNELTFNHNSNGVQNAQVDFTPPRDATYRIMVESVGGATGRYTFKITPADAGTVRDRQRATIENQFRQRDKNGDGLLNMDEMPQDLKNNLAKWDKNRDGLISLEEFLEYRGYSADPAPKAASQSAAPRLLILIDEEELERRPSMIRAGKLPPGLPDWFQKFDTDRDGQVALWEWRKGGKGLEEFKSWDFNDDGFITAEEALRKQEQDRFAAAKKRPG